MTLTNTALAIIEKNRVQNLYYHAPEDGGVILVPQGWCDEFTVATGHAGGPDNEDEPELYGYLPGMYDPADDFDTQADEATGWVEISDLEALREVTEEEARTLDPNLFRLLEAIDAEAADEE